jgi:head-tail adaptor
VEKAVIMMYNQTADVYSKSLTSDGAGGYTPTWTKTGSVPCRIWQKSSNENETAGIDRVVQITYKCGCPLAGLAITDKDQLRVGAIIYDIIGIYEAAKHHREFTLIEYRPGI